ncbi:MAG: thiamine phosphate synthase [Geminicoccaceae bacterium]
MSTAEDWIDPDEAGVRIILIADAATAPAALAAALAAAPVTAVAAPGDRVALRQACHAAGVAFLALDAPADGADGVHLRSAEAVAALRERLGVTAIVGAEVPPVRHEAMVAGEAGADYVLFRAADRSGSPDLERLVGMVAWWSELFVLPCAALVAATPEAARAVADAGADFIAFGPELWAGQADPAAVLAAVAAVLPNDRAGPQERR